MSDQTTLVTFLLDKSGSMSSVLQPTIEAFNAYLDGLKQDGERILFSLLQFDANSVEKVCANIPVRDAPALSTANYRPSGGTPLIDAAYKTIKAVEKAVAKRGDAPKVVISIQTDGEENASREYSWDDLADLVKEKTALGWQFNFMGAGIDAYVQGARMGLHTAQAMSYDSSNPDTTRAAFAGRARQTVAYASGLAASMDIGLADKRAAGDAYVDSAMERGARPPGNAGARNRDKQSDKKAVLKPIVDEITL